MTAARTIRYSITDDDLAVIETALEHFARSLEVEAKDATTAVADAWAFRGSAMPAGVRRTLERGRADAAAEAEDARAIGAALLERHAQMTGTDQAPAPTPTEEGAAA